MTGGTIDVLAGQLQLNQSSILAGTLTGAGALNINQGSTYFYAGFSCKLNNIDVGANGGKLGLETNLTYAGNLTLAANGVLDLFGHVLNLTGASTLDGVAGFGTLVDTGTMTLGAGSGQAVLDNGLLLQVKGALTQDGNISLGAGDAGAKVTIIKGAAYNIDGNWNIANPSAIGSITNAGMFAKTGGGRTAQINTSFTSSGTIDVAIGQLQLNGLVNAVNGTVSGAGTLGLAGGQTSFGGALVLDVGSVVQQSGVVVVNKALSYAGIWDQTGGVLSLNGPKVKLTLSGSADLSGGTISGYGGTLILGGSGTAQIGGITFGGPETLAVRQALHQTNTINFGLSSNPTGTIATGASWLLEGNGGNGDNSIYGIYGLIDNSGTFGLANATGDAVVQPSISSTGTLLANGGTLTLDGTGNYLTGLATGSGLLDLGGATVLRSGLTLSVAALNIDGTVALNANEKYGNAFSQNAGTLDLAGNTFALTGPAALDGGLLTGGGTLTASGATVLGQYTVDALTVLSLTGAAEQTSQSTTINGTVALAATGTYSLDDDTSINGTGTLISAGTVLASGTGTSTITPYLVSTGTLEVMDQDLKLTGGGTLGGTLSGTGTLELSSQAGFTVSGPQLSVQSLQLDAGTTLLLTAGDTYAGNFVAYGGTLALAANTLSLSGASTLTYTDIAGGGRLVLSGGGTLSNTSVLSGAVLEIAGNSEQIGTLQVGDQSSGGTPASTASLIIDAKATYTLDNAASIAGNGTLLVASQGTLAASANTSLSLGPTIVDSGTIAANLGTLTVLQAVSGSGSFLVGSAGLLDFARSSSIGTATQIKFTAGGGGLQVDSLASFNATLDNFGHLDAIIFSSMSGSLSFGYGATQNQIVVTDTSNDTITLNFAAAQNTANFTYALVNGHSALQHI
jgi:hypothetical protein